MFAITEGTRKVYGKEITTYTREIYSANVLEVEAGTNGFQGGDSGHGGRTYIWALPIFASILWGVMATRVLNFSSAATVNWRP